MGLDDGREARSSGSRAGVTALVEGSSHAALYIDEEGVVRYANRAAEALLDAWKARVGDPVPEVWRQRARAARAARAPTQFRQDVGERILSLTVSRAEDCGGVLIHAHDVTQYQQVADRFSRYEFIVNHAQTAMSLVRRDYIYETVNDAYCRAQDKRRSQIVGRSMAEVWGEALFEEQIRPLADRCFEGEDVRRESWFEFPGLGRRCFEVAYSPYRTTAGEITHAVVVSRDVTQAKFVEEALRDTTSRLAVLIANLDVAVLVEDEAGRIVLANAALCELFGFSSAPESLEGIQGDMLVRGARHRFADPEGFQARIEQLVAHQHLVRGDVLQTVDDRILERDYIPTFHAEKYRGHLWSYRDVTAQREAEFELKRAMEQAESASESKSIFLSTMSHEIRTPLNAIVGLAELLQETSLTHEQQEMFRRLQSNSESLLEIINETLDFSKIEAGETALESVPFPPVDLIEEVAEALSGQAELKGLELVCSVDPTLPRKLVGDPVRLRQIVFNLAGNAIKFTERGEVTVSLQRAGGSLIDESTIDEEVDLELSVTDTGIGMERNDLVHIFEPFRQVDRSTTRRFGGTGLGLSITQNLVELMGGTIQVDSTPGRGTEFRVRLALPRGKADHLQLDPWFNIALGRRALVVDDSEAYRRAIEVPLRYWGFAVDEARTADEALAILTHPDQAHDIALIDFAGEDLDGKALAETIRADEALADLEIVFFSPLRHIDSRVIRSLRIGGWTAKPVLQRGLFEALKGAMGLERPLEDSLMVAPAEPDSPPDHRGRLLLAEDHPDNQQLALHFLHGAGYDVDLAENGEVAVEMVMRADYDLVLMDLEMPVLDGIDATRQIREWEREEQMTPVTIVTVTAHAVGDFRSRCLEQGMDGYLTKPYRKKQLVEAVEQWVETAKANREGRSRPR